MWRIRNDEVYGVADGGSVPLHIKYIPSVCNSVAISFFGAIYKQVALWLVNNENHRQTHDYEDSLINKIYQFQFINAYISTYLFAYWIQDFYNASYNLVIVIVGIQFGNNLFEWFSDAFLTQRKINAVRAKYEERLKNAKDMPGKEGELERADIELAQFCEEQMVMKTEKGEQFVWFYNEQFVQLGFIAFFAFVFPPAPLFSLITNFLEIRVKLNSMTYYSKRNPSLGASGIGSWLPIMELISMICIPINVAIIYFTGYIGEKSVFVQYLQGKNEEALADGNDVIWTNENIIWLLILLEHAILGLKVVISVLIPDVPQAVLFEEFREEQIGSMAKKEIQVFKIITKSENFEDSLSRL